MIYTDLTHKAINLAFKAHDGQLDKSGLPYILHPIHVAEQMNDEITTCIALMHDVLEDTDYKREDLEAEGFPEEIIVGVETLTKPDDISYEDYIKNVKKNPYATKVKLADIEHNSDLTRIKEVNEKDIKRLEKYAKAKAYLMS